MKTFSQLSKEIAARASLSRIPDFVKPVCILCGSPYEMGYQLGSQMEELLCTHLLLLCAKIKKSRKDADVLPDAMKFEAAMGEKCPWMLDLWRGAAEGAALPYEAIVLYNTAPNLMAPLPCQCSTISAWGSATKDGRLIAGANADGPGFSPTCYSPAMVLYPDRGNALICNGGLSSNLALNSKGLVTMASNGGWNGCPGDRGVGVAAVQNTVYVSWMCDTPGQALDKLCSGTLTGSAENFHCAALSGGGSVAEITNSRFHIRRSGDFGEQDYILATNYFLSKEMQASRPANWQDQNARYRYQSENRMLQDLHGRLDVEALDNILSSTDYLDDQGQWVRGTWNQKECRNTPLKRHPDNATYMQCIAVPEEKAFYLRQGQKCTFVSGIAHATGRFSKLVLKETPYALAEQAACDARYLLWECCARLETGQTPGTPQNLARLDQAKEEMWKSQNLLAHANLLSEDPRASMKSLSRAVTGFCRVQTVAGSI